MTQKVQISREVADAIEFQLTRKTPEQLLQSVSSHICLGGKFINRSAVLNNITLAEMARILYVGYEVEETDESKFAEWYRNLDAYKYSADNLKRIGADTTLELLGLKIEGVNA